MTGWSPGNIRRLLVMAVTRLSDGVCVACVDEENRWVRPTRQKKSDWRQLEIADLHDAAGRLVVAVGNVVDWELDRPVPQFVHSEDVLIGRSRPTLVAALPMPELLARCAAICQPDLTAFLRSSDRSLMLCRPQYLRCCEFRNDGKHGMSARIYFAHERIIDDFGVTDLRWRALGRRLLTERRAPKLSLSQMAAESAAGAEIRYLAVGRGQPWEEKKHLLAGAHWPFFISVVTEPPLQERVDVSSL